MTTHSTVNPDAVAAYYYTCGYNDHRQQETGRPQPYVDPQEFTIFWLGLCAGDSRPSIQDAFKAFVAQS